MEEKTNYAKKYYQDNKISFQQNAKKYFYKNPNYFKDYYQKHKDRLKKYQRLYIAKKRAQLNSANPRHDKIKSKLKLKSNKIGKDLEILKAKAEAFKLSLIQTSNPDM